ncbi:hypothetical protein CAL7716_085690 [Calothrix sp. PCC 7716]|nr:hypothetical protein CAL7716_085690 [Calothrix sp. PCC 7716]
MSDLLVVEKFSLLVIDSRLIADELGLSHSTWMTNVVKKYESKIEANFGVIHFENGKPETGSKGGRPELFAWFTEEQATFLMTLSRNTDQVIEAKIKLVKAFTEAKRMLAEVGTPAPTSQPMTQIQILASIAQQMALTEQQLLHQDARIAAIEAEQQRYLAPHGHKYTVMGFANLHKLNISAKEAAAKGRAASNICRSLGIEIEKIRDPRFGEVGLYPENVLVQVFQ